MIFFARSTFKRTGLAVVVGVAGVARAVVPADIVITRSAILAGYTFALVHFALALLSCPPDRAYALIHVDHVVASGVINARIAGTLIDVC